jgi:hypothetical protein
MTQDNVMAMKPHIKQRYGFVASAFVRMWGHTSLHDHRIVEFCTEWAYKDVNAPLGSLYDVDQYFYYEFKSWRGY